MAKDVPERGSPETTMIGFPNRILRYRRYKEELILLLLGSGHSTGYLGAGRRRPNALKY
jgi:hypothetical protein